MIKATLVFEENENGLVVTSIEAPPADGTETESETGMLITFMAFNNCLSDAKYHPALAAVLRDEIKAVMAEGE